MAEYWKSTPKYWCKFCSVFVRDTKFERTQHEATGRHQGNIQRSLKGLHREQQAEQRKQQQAKDEVARLNGLVGGSKAVSDAPQAGAPAAGDGRPDAKPTFSKSQEKKATLEDRKRQIAQLAAMGIAVPDQVRGEFAQAGEWQVVSEKIIGEDGKEQKGLSTGVRKRKLDEEEQEQIAAAETITKKKGWGNTFKRFPGKMGGAEEDLDALLGLKEAAVKPELHGETPVKSEDDVKAEPGIKEDPQMNEERASTTLQDIPTAEEAGRTEESSAAAPAVVFKKRKKIGR